MPFGFVLTQPPSDYERCNAGVGIKKWRAVHTNQVRALRMIPINAFYVLKNPLVPWPRNISLQGNC